MRSPEEISRIVEEFKSGHQTQKSFCAEKGLSISTFSYWLRKDKDKKDPAGNFLKISTEPSCEKAVPEITYPNGVTVKIPGASLSFIRQLIKLY